LTTGSNQLISGLNQWREIKIKYDDQGVVFKQHKEEEPVVEEPEPTSSLKSKLMSLFSRAPQNQEQRQDEPEQATPVDQVRDFISIVKSRFAGRLRERHAER